MPSLDSRQIGDIVAGVFTPARQTLEVVGAPPIFQGPSFRGRTAVPLHAFCPDVGPKWSRSRLRGDLPEARFWPTSVADHPGVESPRFTSQP